MSPLELLFPGEPDQLVETLPDRVVSTLEASTWFVGNPDWLMTLRDNLDKLVRAITGPPKPGKKFAVGGVVHKEKETK